MGEGEGGIDERLDTLSHLYKPHNYFWGRRACRYRETVREKQPRKSPGRAESLRPLSCCGSATRAWGWVCPVCRSPQGHLTTAWPRTTPQRCWAPLASLSQVCSHLDSLHFKPSLVVSSFRTFRAPITFRMKAQLLRPSDLFRRQRLRLQASQMLCTSRPHLL